ncbi:rhodanese-like domain-containing protein [Flavihumibacter sp. CACIAM 22H1]|uniref:rhodanese-like domain-containing protein n=1 Tax=Flavihumibacter sp. CACIAM 22H1 TaxID=1812911 RepID=UPI0007A86E64|nr:rhodanese-like domain-containing protein [Flavihumibacter sp. CACIAM 22H1]KYP14507.1 MAG: hypothetical protein A1D16_15380 [Flavihumibacter sp. CACIAM 22H1]
MKRGAWLVDVREAFELKQLSFNVDRIIHMPLRELLQRFRELPADQELVLVCWNGSKSHQAATVLIQLGFDTKLLANMRNGLERWVSKGFPVLGDPSVLGDLSGKFTCGGKGNCC